MHGCRIRDQPSCFRSRAATVADVPRPSASASTPSLIPLEREQAEDSPPAPSPLQDAGVHADWSASASGSLQHFNDVLCISQLAKPMMTATRAGTTSNYLFTGGSQRFEGRPSVHLTPAASAPAASAPAAAAPAAAAPADPRAADDLATKPPAASSPKPKPPAASRFVPCSLPLLLGLGPRRR